MLDTCSIPSRCWAKQTKLGKAAMALKMKRRMSVSGRLSRSLPMYARRRKLNKMNATVTKLKREMKQIRKEQNSIREGQGQVKEKFAYVSSEYEKLREETEIITRQSNCTRLRLTLMFGILKARQNNDFATAAQLTISLREMIAQQKNHDLQ